MAVDSPTENASQRRTPEADSALYKALCGSSEATKGGFCLDLQSSHSHGLYLNIQGLKAILLCNYSGGPSRGPRGRRNVMACYSLALRPSERAGIPGIRLVGSFMLIPEGLRDTGLPFIRRMVGPCQVWIQDCLR